MEPESEPVVTKEDVADLLENFADYVDPEGNHNPWFEVSQINQQFAWPDVPEETLKEWLDELAVEEKVETEGSPDHPRRWRWRS